ncbi:MAG: MBL fold metallo-hydrolase [Chloroflexi bacterium]|nr:MBL fold metallo-hydrolase [Chloroflexota bacterium]
MATRIESFGDTANVELTILVDNRTDQLVESTESVKRFTDAPLLAEHGFAALVHLKESGARILWDAGYTRIALLENLRWMKMDPATINQIALSHGDDDHTTAVTEILKAMDLKPQPRQWNADATSETMRAWAVGRRVSIIAHPAAFRERWILRDDGTRRGPLPIPPRDEWQALGGQIVLSEGPCQLAPGVWTTGAIPRRSFETIGVSPFLYYREGNTFVKDQMEDDQALVIHLRDKGLVVLSGCAHSGIVNTVNYAREISGVEQVFAIIGGFHLARAKADLIQRTISEIGALDPQLVAPSHCSGFKTTMQFAEQMPDAFVQALVGTTYAF